MMTKTNTKKSSTMARVALGATAALALAGRAHAQTAFETATGGTAGSPGLCTAIEFDGTTFAIDVSHGGNGGAVTGLLALKTGVTTATTFDHCVVAPGYYMYTKAASSTSGAGLQLQRSPDNWYALGGTVITAAADVYRLSSALISSDAVVGKIQKCPDGSASPSATANVDIGACKLSAGYYLSTAGSATSTPKTAGTILKVPSGSLITSTANAAVTSTASTIVLCSGTYTGVSNDHMVSISPATTAATHCKTKPGYEVTTVGTATQVRVSAVRAGSYNPGGIVLTTSTLYDGTLTCEGTFTGALTSSITVQALASANTQCVLKPGYSIKTASSATNGNVQTKPTEANKYNPGGSTLAASASLAVGDGDIACPFAGTSPEGSSAQSQCTPDCATTNTGSNAVASQGTCVCAANFYGSPIDADGNQAKPAKHGCLACPTGMVSGAGMRSCVYPAAAATAATPAAATPGAPGAPGASSGASSVSVFAAVAAIAAAQFAF